MIKANLILRVFCIGAVVFMCLHVDHRFYRLSQRLDSVARALDDHVKER